MTQVSIVQLADHLERSVSPTAAEQLEAAQRLVALARRYGNDAGTACLAGVWLGEGMSEHEIVARLWPQHRTRLAVVR